MCVLCDFLHLDHAKIIVFLLSKAAASFDVRHFNVDEPDPKHDRFATGINKDFHKKSSKEMERRDSSKCRKRRVDDRDYDNGAPHHASPICKTAANGEQSERFYKGVKCVCFILCDLY